MAANQINLQTVLKHLDLGNLNLYASYARREEDRKELDRMLSFIIPLWVSGCVNHAEQFNVMLAFNEHINLSWWELEGHPELRAKVLAAIGLGKVVRHNYHYRGRMRQTGLTELLAYRYPDIRKDEVYLWCSINTEATLIEMCQNHGVQEAEREPILTEYRSLLS